MAGLRSSAKAAVVKVAEKLGMKIPHGISVPKARHLYGASQLPPPPDITFAAMPKPPERVVPKDAPIVAMDEAFGQAFYNPNNYGFASGQGWLGYPYLAELTQRPEFRRISEVQAREMTRKWIKLISTGTEDKTDKIKKLEEALKRLKVQDLFRRAAEQDGFFGRSQIYIDLGDETNEAELKTPLIVDAAKIAKGGLKAFRVIEPIWSYPAYYNSTDPLHPAYFKPTSWFIMAREVHSSRLLTFVGREMPDLLKPAYSFGGLSLSQMALPYVDNWLRTRQSVSNLIHSFSVMVLKTNLLATLAGLNSPNSGGGADEVNRRVALFNNYRDNSGTFVLDMDTEDFANVSAPLGSLDKLQAQSQEQMASVAAIPLVKLLGITPSGLNASSDGEIRTFYDWIHSCQETLFTAPLSKVIDIIQLSEFGEIDPEIGFEFEPLWQLDDAGKAAVEKTKADTDEIFVNMGALGNEDVRARLAGDSSSQYHGLDLSGPAPGPPVDPAADPNDPESNSIDKESEEGKSNGATSGV